MDDTRQQGSGPSDKGKQPVNGQNPSSRRSRGRKNFRKGKSSPSRPKAPLPVCAMCEKPIESITQAMGGPGKEEVSHFDCVIRTLSEHERLEQGQKVSYIGNGNFAVIQYANKNYSGGFTVVRRIAYETQEMTSFVKRMVADRKRTVR